MKIPPRNHDIRIQVGTTDTIVCPYIRIRLISSLFIAKRFRKHERRLFSCDLKKKLNNSVILCRLCRVQTRFVSVFDYIVLLLLTRMPDNMATLLV